MEPIRQEVKSFVEGCKHLLSAGPALGLSPQEFNLIEHYFSEVETLLCDYEDEIRMRRRTDAA